MMDKNTNALPVVFSGQGRDYFGIWAVNLLLTILTLGIYSAWAKVRRMHFFYRHTSLAGAAFDYHGEPLSILKGRTLAFLMFMAYQISAETEPIVAAIVFVILMAVMPWLLHRSLCFRMHNSSYRGLRFLFRGGVRGCCKSLLTPAFHTKPGYAGVNRTRSAAGRLPVSRPRHSLVGGQGLLRGHAKRNTRAQKRRRRAYASARPRL